MNMSITALFCCIDDFAKVFEDCERKQLISTRRKRLRSGKLSLSEMLFIMVLFHVSPFNLNSAVGARQNSGKLLMLNQCLCLESSTMANPFGEAL